MARLCRDSVVLRSRAAERGGGGRGGGGKLTKATDVYSFAMIMWEMYSGTALFRGMNSSQVR